MSSIVERDLILRMVKQLAALLARVFRLKQSRQYGEASRLVTEGYHALFRLDRRFLQIMQPSQVALALGHPEKVKAFVKLMAEEADLLRLQNDLESAAASARWALAIFEAAKVPVENTETRTLLFQLRTLAAAER